MEKEITSTKLEIDFHSFFYRSSLPMSLLSADMKLKAVNQESLSLLHYTEEEMLGKSISEFVAVGDIGFDFESLKKLFKREIGNYALDRSYKAKDGSLIPGVITISLIDFQGENYILGIFLKRMDALEQEGVKTQNNNTLSKILAINPDIHYIMDIPNKNYVYQNIDILEYFGYSEKDLEGKNKIEFLISKIDTSSIQEVFQASKDFKKRVLVGEFVQVEYKFLSKNEGWKWLRAKSTPLGHISPGKVSLSYGFIQDITHQKDIEQKLLGQEAFINQIANLVPDVVAVYNIDTYEVAYSNLKDRTFLGYNEKQWTDKKSVIPKDIHKKHLRDQELGLRNLKDDEVIREEVEYYNKKGEARWIVIKSKIFKRNKSGAPEQILLVAADINDYKTTVLKLAEAKRTNNAIIGAIPELLLVVNREGIYTSVISGVESNLDDNLDIVGKTLFDVLSLDNAIIIKQLVGECLDTGEVKYHNFEHFYSDGRPSAYFSNYISRLNMEEVLVIARDETQKKIAQKSLDDKINLLSIQNGQLEKFIKKNSELERFAYIIAHDLKEPLRNISAISELIGLETVGMKNENLNKLLEHVSENSDRMIALIEGVLDYSKIDSEPVEFKIDLDVLVNNMLDDLRTIIISKNVEVQLGELGEIKGNETQIRQLFQNLISNAIKFQADETPKVIIDKRIVGGVTSYFVEDNGIGIEPAFRNSIFMMFKRVNNYGKYPGQGIGLSMCKRVIESHGGRIWIESNDENKPGSRFCFTIASD